MRSSLLKAGSGALLVAALAACNTTPVGPNYALPKDSIANKPQAQIAFAGVKQESAIFNGDPLPDHWWRLYKDARLDGLIEKALANNTDLRQAVANLEKERAIDIEVAGARLPQIGVTGGVTDGHISGLQELRPGYEPPANIAYSVGASLSYQIDLFGRIRRAIEASEANTEAAQAALDLVRVNVAAGTARAYAEICSTGLRLQSANKSVSLQNEALDISDRLQKAGRVGVIDASRARAQLEQLKSAIPTLLAEKQSALYRLATLTGDLPQDFPRDVADCSNPPRVTGILPVGDGAALIKRRPDVRQAERSLAAATANIGVATADLYPRISLGLSANSAGFTSDFGGRDTFSWSLGPLISWTIPNTGAAKARIAQSEASTRGALAKFDGTVLNALRETETALNVYARELDRHASLQAARDQSAVVAGQARRLYTSGRTAYLDTLDAERALALAEANLSGSDALLAADQVALFMALGGGWETSAATASR